MAHRKSNNRAAAGGSVALGALMLVAGIGLTMGSDHTVFVGLIVVGAITLLGGLAGLSRR